jgi:hypothetical protein
VVEIDQVVRCVGEEGVPLQRARPLRRRIRPGDRRLSRGDGTTMA